MSEPTSTTSASASPPIEICTNMIVMLGVAYRCGRAKGHTGLHGCDNEPTRPKRWQADPPMCRADYSEGMVTWECNLSYGHDGFHSGNSNTLSFKDPRHNLVWLVTNASK